MAHGEDGAVPDTGKSFDSLYAVNPQQALAIEAQKMKAFKKRVDDLLIALGDSEASPDRMGEGRVSRAQLGSAEFGEAQYLYESYTVVHDELEKLSKVLGAQIEGMGLAVHASRVGYDNINQDVRERMRSINTEVASHYDRERDPFVKDESTEKKADKEAGF
ncbi:MULTISPECIES: hypothetical protein [Streptomyces]|uniref:Uncharacterized protein n=1 Tax=Streptomyces californicus TaxID=67351 RepID=A0ABD7CZE2_9ACTN|nr:MULTISPECIES: hypothetical protein [Streptomyces]MBD3545902.1 hypothetical protein [Streptomyces sp. JV180]QRV27686.1 hypothetical protein I6J39_10440 [Streptomyces californicus]QRV36650.1 hypothetical protein I6J42_23310 [Streptomyces californicus]QRV41085.1 hypothetical protein I6J41_10275 [Streptomyces californicus]QRV47840.1 hypothetical protein I6J43_10315 [Streptomyces californicus]